MKTKVCKCGRIITLDDSDYDAIGHRVFQCGHTGVLSLSFRTSKGVERISVANVILGGRQLYDHKDRNSHNMQRDNLRPATRSQNNANTRHRGSKTGFRNVRLRHGGQYWAEVRKDKRLHYSGPFDNPTEAAQSADELMLQLHGEFAVLNFPQALQEKCK